MIAHVGFALDSGQTRRLIRSIDGVGLSGAPGGQEQEEACAKAGIANVARPAEIVRTTPQVLAGCHDEHGRRRIGTTLPGNLGKDSLFDRVVVVEGASL